MAEPTLPPLDPELGTQIADADRERAKRYFRQRLAEGSLHPSRRRLIERELTKLEAA